jgi:hypothetical protein
MTDGKIKKENNSGGSYKVTLNFLFLKSQARLVDKMGKLALAPK